MERAQHAMGWTWSEKIIMANDNQQSSAPLPSLTDSLEQAAQSHKGTDLGGLIQWAILHIQDQREAIEMKESEVAFLLCENRKMHASIAAIMAKADDLSALAYNAHPTRDYVGTVDTAPHINIMGGHYRDPDYLRGKMASSHKDTRGK